MSRAVRPPSGPALQAPRRRGRLRVCHHAAVGALGVAAAWYGFGPLGVLLAAGWAWHTRPPPVPWGAQWLVRLDDVKRVRQGPWRTRIRFRQGGVLDIYRDEMDGADLARWRRTLAAGSRQRR